MREAGFLFYFLFPQKQMRETGLSFYFLRHIYMSELLYSPTMFHGRCTTCTAPDDILTDTRAMLDIKSGDFLEKRPFTISRRKTPLLRKMRRLYTCTKPHKKSIPSTYSIFRRSGKCLRNIRYWTNLDETKLQIFLRRNFSFFFFLV